METPWTAEVSPDNALPDYPRPQLARPSVDAPEWLNLNGLWQYAPTDGFSAPPIGRDLEGDILVPFPAESALSGVQEYSEYMFYRRTVEVPREFTRNGQRLRLNFGAVNYDATVWVNGTQVVRHTGAYDAFSADITSALRDRGPQEIVVAVHSPVDAAEIPVGKQRLDPSGIFYTAASGIWQSVWLEPVAPTSIASFTATPDVATSSFSIATTVNGDPTDARLNVEVFAGDRRVARASGAAGGPMQIAVPRPRLWSPDDPFLYTFKVTLTKGGTRDRVESYAGLRSIGLEVVDGKQRMVVNGEPVYMMGTLDQGYWPDGIYTAPTDEALRFDIERTKELGFNMIRKHIKVEPARWYYWADKLGMLVWQDAPSLRTGDSTRLSNAARANFRAETARMVEQHRNVTSIIGWVPFNEGWGQWSVQAATDVGAQVKALDPTRLVNNRSGYNCCDMPGDPGTGDIIDEHLYQGPALPPPDANRASMDGEHGGLTLPVDGHQWPSPLVNPYGSVEDSEALTQGYVDNTAVLRDQGAPYGLSGSVYTQITDVEGEQNGFYTYDRQVLKVDAARVREVNLQTIAAAGRPIPTPPAGVPGLGGKAAWSFDEGTGTTAADSVGDDDLTLVGGASWTEGVDGSALSLNGAGQFAESDGTVLPTNGTDYTVSAWVRMNDVGGAFQTIMSEDSPRNSAFFLQYSGFDRRFAFSFAGIRAVGSAAEETQPGQWYHVVGVRDVTRSTLELFVDGELVGSAKVLGNADQATGDLVVGRGQFGGNPVDFFAGAVDDARAYDRALSADEVAALFAAGAGG